MANRTTDRHFGKRDSRQLTKSFSGGRRWNRLRFVACIVVVYLPVIVGCGTNRFQQELTVEEAAVKLANETIEGNYSLISTKELKQLLDSKEAILLVDTMPADSSYNKGHIAGAVNFMFPKDAIEEWNESTMGKQTIEEFEAMLGADKDRKIVFYCGFVKCARSHNGAAFAKELGYTNVFRHPGGIDAWRGAGYGLIAK